MHVLCGVPALPGEPDGDMVVVGAKPHTHLYQVAFAAWMLRPFLAAS